MKIKIVIIILFFLIFLSINFISALPEPEAYWSFDEKRGVMVKDGSGNNHHGWKRWDAPWIKDGIKDGALRLRDRVRVYNLRNLRPNKDFTGCTAFRSNLGKAKFSFVRVIGAGRAWGIYLNLQDDTIEGWTYDGSWGQPAKSKNKFEENRWYFVCIVHEFNSNLKLYVNGELQNPGNIRRNVKPSRRSRFEIGMKGLKNNLDVDESYFFNEALTESEIRELYIQSGGKCSDECENKNDKICVDLEEESKDKEVTAKFWGNQGPWEVQGGKGVKAPTLALSNLLEGQTVKVTNIKGIYSRRIYPKYCPPKYCRDDLETACNEHTYGDFTDDDKNKIGESILLANFETVVPAGASKLYIHTKEGKTTYFDNSGNRQTRPRKYDKPCSVTFEVTEENGGDEDLMSNTGYKVCGNYDEDKCLEWGEVTQCMIGCEDGTCLEDEIEDVEYLTGENKKRMDLYNNKEVFMISNTNWKNVLPWVSTTTWTQQEGDDDNCKRGYGTPDNVCVNPFLIWHEEESSFDPDSIIHFLQQYLEIKKNNKGITGLAVENGNNNTNGTDERSSQQYDSNIQLPPPFEITIIGKIAQEFVDLLITEPEFGAGLSEEQIKKVKPEDYLSYWENCIEVVYVEDNYELALLASTYASLINAPLIIQESKWDNEEVFAGRKIICVGDVKPPKGRKCNEKYGTKEKLQKKYVELTKTNKMILTNPNDLDISDKETLSTEKSGQINEINTKTSLISASLAASKHQVLVTIPNNKFSSLNPNSYYLKGFSKSENFNEIFEINNKLKSNYKNLYGDFECNTGDSCSSGFSKKDLKIFKTQEIVIDTSSVSVLDITQVRLLTGNFVNCPSGFVIVKIDYGGIPLKEDILKCNTKSNIFLGDHSGYNLWISGGFNNEAGKRKKGTFKNLKLDKFEIKIYGGDFVPKDNGWLLQMFAKFRGELIDCDRGDNCDLSKYLEENVKVPIAYKDSYYKFKDIDISKEYYLSYKIDKIKDYKDDNFNIYINGNLFLEDIKISHSFKDSIEIPSELLKENTEIKIRGPNKAYYAEIKIIPKNYYITFMGAHNAIPHRFKIKFRRLFENLDSIVYSDFNGDFLSDFYVGRIKGLTTSDVSSLVARNLFYNHMPRTNNMKFITSQDTSERRYGWISYVTSKSNQFTRLGYNAIAKTSNEMADKFNPEEWKDQDTVFYLDHGMSNWAGIKSKDIPPLTNSVFLNFACKTDSSNNANAFSLNSIRNGAIAYFGAVDISSAHNKMWYEVFDRIYKKNEPLGKIFKDSVKIADYGGHGRESSFIGDPTFVLNPPYLTK